MSFTCAFSWVVIADLQISTFIANFVFVAYKLQQLLLCMTSVDAYIFRGVRQQGSHDDILGFIFRVMTDFVSGF